MSKPEMLADRLRDELAEVKRQRDKLRTTMKAVQLRLLRDNMDDDRPSRESINRAHDLIRAALKSTEANP